MFEKVSKVCWGPALVLLTLGVATAEDQRLPLADGAYLSEEHCDMAERNELDMIGFQVEKNGRSVSMYESTCLVAVIKSIRSRRYHVEMDCREIVDFHQYQFFLDVISSDHIRVDGEDLFLCTKGFLSSENSDAREEVETNDLVESWADAEEGCRGGFGNDPETYKACERREELVKKLSGMGMCYGKEWQSTSEFDWHKCEKSSIRYSSN